MSAKAEKSEKADKTEGGGKKKLPLPAIIGVVLLLVGIFVGKSVLGGGKKDAKAEKKPKAEMGISLPLDEFLVNLDGGGDHYLRAQISLGLKKGLTEEGVKEHVAPMRDAILSILRTKTLAQVTKAKDVEALKDELKDKINESMSEEKGEEKSHDSKDSKDKDDKSDKKSSKDKDDKDDKSDKDSTGDIVLKVYFTAFATQ